MSNLSTNFTTEELACKCGCGMLPKPELIEALQRLRTVYGKPIIVTSGARCAKHNAETPNAAPNSRHVLGEAVDIEVESGRGLFDLIALAHIWFKGIGLYSNHPLAIHLDIRAENERELWVKEK